MLVLRGILANVQPNNIKLVGIHYKNWEHESVPPGFFKYGTRKRVTRDKKTCTIRVNKKTTVVNADGELADLADFHSCSVRVTVVLKKYFIKPDIEGWSIIAHSVEPDY